ncbi:MAG TPA: glycosyltransferase family 39 protein [Candidatus Methanoperedens sp.]|nr:glycosyltransferase family 39 protein [Candidatus Methanoperedens sp.]
MTPRAKSWLLALLLLLGAAYRLLAAYPLVLERFAPASSSLQAMHILAGERPIFYAGQAWMGPAGAYLIAGMFKLFGASTLTLGAFSWLMSVLFLLGSVLLAHRLFGLDNALVTAALFLVPVDYLMNLAGQPRAHYTICFVLVPAYFLATLALLRRQRDGRPLRLAAFLLGLLGGFSFWTNMAIGPAVGISLALLLWHLRLVFFTRVLAPWVGGWLLGFSPVIWYNLTNQAILANQVNADNTQRLGRVLKAFVTNAWPRFWGVDFTRTESRALNALLVALLVWIAVLFFWALAQGWRRWRRQEDTVGYQLVFGYFALHLAVTAGSSYGSRFETGTPLSYVGMLYAVAFSIPGLVLQSGVSRRAKALALLPLGLFVADNLVANAFFTKRFFATVRQQGLAQVTRYPNEANPFVRLCRERGLAAGYAGRAFKGDSAKHQNFLLNLEAFGVATFADPAAERYVESALAADSARKIFWVGADQSSLRMIGASWKDEPVQKWVFSDGFAKELREATVIAAHPAGAEPGRAGAAAVTDGGYDTVWSGLPQEGSDEVLEFAFAGPQRLREVVLFPKGVVLSPRTVFVDVSDDGATWRPAGQAVDALPMFWSVWHPFLKAVKPRLEIALAPGEPARFCRLRFVGSWDPGGVGIREVLFLGDGPVIDPAEWEREIEDVLRTVREQGRNAVVVGDHWFVDFFRREGFATDFISNQSVNDAGKLNPNLVAPVPVDFTRPQVLIVGKAFVPSIEGLLRRRGVAFSETALRHHVVCVTRPAAVAPPLFWNGLELNELGGDAGLGDQRARADGATAVASRSTPDQ